MEIQLSLAWLGQILLVQRVKKDKTYIYKSKFYLLHLVAKNRLFFDLKLKGENIRMSSVKLGK